MRRTLFLFFLAACLLLNLNGVHGQAKRYSFLGLEAGMTTHACDSKSFDFIRGDVDVSTYGISDDSDGLDVLSNRWYAGLRTEIRNPDNFIGWCVGIRYSQVFSSMEKTTSGSGGKNFFYLLNKHEETTTEFLRVEKVAQTTQYIGVPIESRIYITPALPLRIYGKLGGELNYRIDTSTDVTFHNKEMEEPYEEEVAAKFKEPNNFMMMIYAGGGLMLRGSSKASIGLEVTLPAFIVSDNTSGLVDPLVGIGVQLSVQVPLTKPE